MRHLVLALTVLAFASPVLAGEQFTNEPPVIWSATPCDTWNCAVAALTLADGNPRVMVLPTRSRIHPWVVITRMAGGDVHNVDTTFVAECFSSMYEASARFLAVEQDKMPLLVTAVDGAMLVVSLKDAEAPPTKRRATRTN
jgi:hypothetical protein